MTAMVRALTAILAIVLSSSVAAKPPGAKAGGGAPSAPIQSPMTAIDTQAETQLLELTNQARGEAGVGPLQQHDGLTQAARAHAAEMAAQQQISHQFPGEPALTDRIAIVSDAHLDRAAENVAYAGNADRVEVTLMN